MTWNDLQHDRGSDGRFVEMSGSAPDSALVQLQPDEGEPGTDLGPFRVRTDCLEDYPAWPLTLPQRRIDWSYDDDSGLTQAQVMVGRAWSVSGWRDIYGDFHTDIADSGDPAWTTAERDAVEETLRVAQGRSDSVVGDIEWHATNAPGMSESIRSAVAGEPARTVPVAAIMSTARRTEVLDLLAEYDGARDHSAPTNGRPDGAKDGTHGEARNRFADRAAALLRELAGAHHPKADLSEPRRHLDT